MASDLRAWFIPHPSVSDRFTLPFMLPASLILALLLTVQSTRRLSRMLLVALTLFAFSAFQVQNESAYREDWLAQKSLFWQFA
jgi:hypothetical protein